MASIGRRAVAAHDLSILMQDAASLIAETLGSDHRCVAHLAPDRSQITHILTRQDSDWTKPRVFIRESGPESADSLAGYALEAARPVIVADLSEDRRFRDRFLQHHGVRAAIAVPLQLQQQSFGALVACNSRSHLFDAEDALFVETVAHLITTTIARVHTEKTLAAERRLSVEILKTVGAMVLLLDQDVRIVRANRACKKITGFSSDELKSRLLWDVFAVPYEADSLQTVFRKLLQGISPIECQSQLLTKHAERLKISWSCAVVPGPGGEVESIVATGIDVTGQRQTDEEEEEADTGRVGEMAPSPASPSSILASDEEQGGLMSSSSEAATSSDALSSAGGSLFPVPKERRRRPRRAYPYCQRIAPIIAGKLPPKEEFAEVRCNDISPGGFSFLSPQPPQSEQFVVALGNAPRFTYLIAQVAHVTDVERDGRRHYLVGCAYVERLAN